MRKLWVSRKKLDALTVAFTKSVLCDPEMLTGLIAGSLKLSAEVIQPFSQRGPGDEIAKLERREKRLIQMCEAEAISIYELKRERTSIRAEIARLRTSVAGTQPERAPLTVEGLARMVINGAFRFQRLVDKREQKAILEQLFAEVFFRDETITAFRFHPALVASMGDSGLELGQTITLEKPFRTTLEVPEGHTMCSRCGVVLPTLAFPKNCCQCPLCYKAAQNEKRKRAFRVDKNE